MATSSRKDAFGIASLANPSYSSQQSAVIERDFIRGGAAGSDGAVADAGRAESDLSTGEMLQRRMNEIEKSVGCPIFSPSASGTGTIAAVAKAPAPRALDDFDDSGIRTDFASSSSDATASFSNTGASAGASTSASSVAYEGARTTPFTLSNEGLHHTEEAEKRDRLASALSVLSIDADGFLDADRERDKKLMMIEEIEDLVNLFKDDGEDVSHIHIPTVDEPFETIQCTLKILKRHNDRRRFGTLADDCIMLAATSLETLCDGKREWLGFSPDLRGWSNHVRAKLRRMHHDTSQIASSIMNDYNIGPGMRLVLELVPNLIMYARNKSLKKDTEADTTPTDAEFDSAVDRLRSK